MTATLPSILIIGFAGLAVGSFGSVVAHRLPRGRSVVTPRSACPACGAQIAAYDNIPILSWLILRGRCRSCATPISARYPLLEATVAILFVAVTFRYWRDPVGIALGCLLVTTLAIVTVTDLERRVIPNKVLAAATLAWALVTIPFDAGSLAEGLIAAAAAGGLLLAVALAHPGGMGMGDVKLAAVMGLYLGSAIAVGLLTALLAGSLLGAVLIARGGARARKQAIPFGPFLALGGVVALLAGPQIVDWYSATFFA